MKTSVGIIIIITILIIGLVVLMSGNPGTNPPIPPPPPDKDLGLYIATAQQTAAALYATLVPYQSQFVGTDSFSWLEGALAWNAARQGVKNVLVPFSMQDNVTAASGNINRFMSDFAGTNGYYTLIGAASVYTDTSDLIYIGDGAAEPALGVLKLGSDTTNLANDLSNLQDSVTFNAQAQKITLDGTTTSLVQAAQTQATLLGQLWTTIQAQADAMGKAGAALVDYILGNSVGRGRRGIIEFCCV